MRTSFYFKIPPLSITLDPFAGHEYAPHGAPLLSRTPRVLRWLGVLWDVQNQCYLPDIYLGDPFQRQPPARCVSLSSLNLNIWGEVRSAISSDVSWAPQRDDTFPTGVHLSKTPWVSALISQVPPREAIVLHEMVQAHHPVLPRELCSLGLVDVDGGNRALKSFAYALSVYTRKEDFPNICLQETPNATRL